MPLTSAAVSVPEAQDALDAAAVVRRLRAAFGSGLTAPLDWRRDQLRRLVRLLRESETELLAALAADVGKPALEAWTNEIGVSCAEIADTLSHLNSWAAPERVPTPLVSRPGRSCIHREPLGVTLIIAPWNYPVQLLVLPLAAALASGNCVLVKPSELAPATSKALARLIPRYLDGDAVAVVEGGVAETTALLAERFDHIFYTGNGRVGRIVMHAAAEHLTPVTLELGGKSPVIVAADADLKVAARRIAWGKYVNAGQTCVAPDHVFVEAKVHAPFLDALSTAIHDFYGADPRSSPDYGRIVNDAHFARVTGLLDGGGYERVVVGGDRDATTRFLAPTVVDKTSEDAPLMGEEIFGPVLPILPVADVDEAIARIQSRDKPLALYAFTGSDRIAQHILRHTSSGGMVVNHTLLHLGVPSLPFGGVGASGMGAYHGKAGFETFSHRRAVLRKPVKPDLPILYPPYKGWKSRLLHRML